jgi:hypothetical protein
MFSRLIHKISRLSLLRFFHIFLMYICIMYFATCILPPSAAEALCNHIAAFNADIGD